ncbi:MAG: hypothetical protein J0L52_00365 [Caulobacterales bacterium]|nr:hypothetical protein [Caulobacterales bacterium]
MRALVFVSLGLILGACEAERGPEPSSADGAQTASDTMSTKARQAAELVNQQMGPVDDTQTLDWGVDRLQFDIEILSLDAPWRWSETMRRHSVSDDAEFGAVEDLIYSVDPSQLIIPVEVVGEGEGRTDVRLVCRAEPCIRVTGSRAELTGTQAQVAAAMADPQPMDEMRAGNFLPFARRAQAESAAAAMNELLRLQGAEPSTTASTNGDPQ